MKVWYLVAALLLLLGVVLLFWMFRIGFYLKESRKVVSQSQAFSRVDKNALYKVLVVGDSTAVGTGGVPEESVAGRLFKDHPTISIENLAKNGAKIEDVHEQLQRASGRYGLVLMHAGANDILSLTSRAKLEADIPLLLDEAKAKGDVVVLLTAGDVGKVPFFPTPVGWFFTHKTKQVRALLKSEAEARGILYVDLFAKHHEQSFNKDKARYHASDLIHLTGEGYKVWYDDIVEKLTEAGISIP